MSTISSGTATLTLPTTTCNILGDTTTNTVTNKSFVDNSTSIVDNADATKKILFDAGGTTGTSTTITCAQTANRVITMPDSTDTLVDTGSSQQLRNKQLTTSCPFVNLSDTTKQISFNVTNSTGVTLQIQSANTTTQTLSIPNVGSGDSFVTNSTPATITGKTMNNTNNTLTFNNGLTVTGPTTATTPTAAGLYMGTEAGGNTNLEICANSSTNSSYIDFNYPNQDNRGRILYNMSTDQMQISAAATTQMTVKTTDVNFALGITLPTSGGTASILNYNEDNSSTLSFTGPVSVTPTYYWSRAGKKVTFQLAASGNLTSTSATFWTSAALPSRLWPVNTVDSQIWVQDSGTNQTTPGRITVSTAGVINIYKTNPTTNFTGSGTCSFSNWQCNWRVS